MAGPFERQTDQIIAFFKPSEAEIDTIIAITIRMDRQLRDAGLPESLVHKMVWLYWERTFSPQVEIE